MGCYSSVPVRHVSQNRITKKSRSECSMVEFIEIGILVLSPDHETNLV